MAVGPGRGRHRINSVFSEASGLQFKAGSRARPGGRFSEKQFTALGFELGDLDLPLGWAWHIGLHLAGLCAQ